MLYLIRTPSTNAIESVNARIRKAVKARRHFPNSDAARCSTAKGS